MHCWQGANRSRGLAAAGICSAAQCPQAPMPAPPGLVRRFLAHHLRRALALLLLAGGLLGCVANPPAPGAAALFPSQESDAQRLVRVRLELAVSYFQEGRADIAEQEVLRALAVDPRSADAYVLLAVIQMQRQELVQAEASLLRALELRPNDADTQHNYGWLLCERERFAEAQQWLDKALQQPGYREQPKTWMTKGLCMQRAGDLAQAHDMVRKAYELDAANPLYAYHLGNIMLLRGQVQEAQLHVRRINNSPYSNAESLWLGIKIERALQDSAGMRQLAEQLQARFPQSRQWQAYQRGAFDAQ